MSHPVLLLSMYAMHARARHVHTYLHPEVSEKPKNMYCWRVGR